MVGSRTGAAICDGVGGTAGVGEYIISDCSSTISLLGFHPRALITGTMRLIKVLSMLESISLLRQN